jgi:uncharacterized protein (TIGR00661 family)
MFNIIYAASNSINSKIQLKRFIEAIKFEPIAVKVAAYKNFSPDVQVDWTLDALLNSSRPDKIHFDNDNFRIYYEQIKYFNPDLIISDLEFFTSYAANLLNKPLWQCSSSLINFALSKKEKYSLGLFKKYSYIFNRESSLVQRTINLLDNSNCRFLYSHFGDLNNPPEIDEQYEWIRPYHTIGKSSINCKHNMVAVTLQSNKKFINKIKEHDDIVLFSEYIDEQYPNIQLKNIEDWSEYFCNLKNSTHFVCEGNASILADAFYNDKKAFLNLNYMDTDCIMNGEISNYLNLSTNFSEYDIGIGPRSIDCKNLKPSIKYLHEKILDII